MNTFDFIVNNFVSSLIKYVYVRHVYLHGRYYYYSKLFHVINYNIKTHEFDRQWKINVLRLQSKLLCNSA